MDDLQKALEIKGDVLAYLVKRNVMLLAEQERRLQDVVANLEKLGIPTTTEDGKETQGAVLLNALRFIIAENNSMCRVNEQALAEMDALSEQYEVGSSVGEAIDKLVSYVKAAHPHYANADNETIKRALGIHNE